MTLTPDEMHAACLNEQKRLGDLGYIVSDCAIHINWLSHKFTFHIVFRATQHGQQTTEFCGADTAEGAIEQARKFINDLPSVEDKKREEFTRALGNLIDQGREVGVEVDFMNPLEAMMKKLSTNALENKNADG